MPSRSERGGAGVGALELAGEEAQSVERAVVVVCAQRCAAAA